MATLKEISAELGLSVTTVSRALNGFPEVNEDTRIKVRETAERLGYRPNRIAQRLVTGRSGMVGMILKIRPDMSADQTFFESLTALTAALAERETDLVLAVDQDNDPVQPYRKLLERNIVDGFILNAPVRNDPRVNFLRDKKIPFALHGRDRETPDYPFFDIDNRAVSADAIELLTDLGHQRIALINGETRYAYAEDREIGFRQSLAQRHLKPDWIACDATLERHGYQAALRMLSEAAAPTAFVCFSTLTASGVMKAVRDKGLSIPKDVSVVAHDDALPLTRAIEFNPALTVTRAPLRDAPEPLADQLISVLKGAEVTDHQVLIRAEMILRGSTGPAPKEA